MNTFLALLAVAGFLVIVWYVRGYLRETSEYKYARRQEIKRRLQVEHKQEEALKSLLMGPADDQEKRDLIAKFADERHKRTVNYVIEDVYERWH